MQIQSLMVLYYRLFSQKWVVPIPWFIAGGFSDIARNLPRNIPWLSLITFCIPNEPRKSCMDMCMVEMQYLGLSWQFFSHISFRTYCCFQDAVLAQPVHGFAKHVLESFGLFMIVLEYSVATIMLLFLIRSRECYFVNSAWPCETYSYIPKKLCSDGHGNVGRLNLAMCFGTAWLNHGSTCNLM